MQESLHSVELNILAAQDIEAKEYWMSQMGGEYAATELYTENILSGGNSISAIRKEISTDVTKKLLRISGGSDEKLRTLLVASTALTLYKYTGCQDLVIGTTIDAADDQDALVNSILPLRIKPDTAGTVKDFVYQIGGIQQEAMRYQDYPVEVLAKELNILNETGRSKLFNIGILYKNLQNPDYFKNQNPELLILFEMKGEVIEVEFQCPEHKYSEKTLNQLFVALNRILNFVTESSSKTLTELRIVDKEDTQIGASFMENPADVYDLENTIVSLFESQALGKPGSIAISCQGEDITYEELDKYSSTIANKLVEEGLKPGEVVAVVVERNIETVASILGILKSGCAYLPIELDTPVSRIQFMMDKSNVTGIVCSHASSSIIGSNHGSTGRKLIVVDKNLPRKSFNSPKQVESALAYVIYTSGSTGEPKGVMMSHRSALNLLYGLKDAVFSKHGDRLTLGLLSPFIFDASIQLMFGALVFGHVLQILGVEERMEGGAIINSIEKYGVEVIDGTPTHIALMIKSNSSFDKNHKLKHCIIGGDVLSKANVEKFLDKCGHRKPSITNVYGPTECCVNCSYLTLDNAAMPLSTQIPIGKPLPNYEIAILNQNKELCPEGEPGELCVSGEGLMLGYINDLERTKERLVKIDKVNLTKPFYRTGDLARIGSDGLLYFLGRIDNQIKVRGYRIELGEIDGALNQHKEIKQSISLVCEDEDDKYIVSYYISDFQLDTHDLRTLLSQSLPHYMIPSYFVKVDAIPVTPSGKPDRMALQRYKVVQENNKQIDQPETETERKVLELWKAILKTDTISVNDGFFNIGGDSIRSITLVYELNELFETSFMLMDLYEHDTVRKFSKLVDTASTGSSMEQLDEAVTELDKMKQDFFNKI
jgi:bacitracin synthase 1/bacitracin synthase 3